MTDNTFTEFLIYKTPQGNVKIDVFLKDETIWLPQKRIAELFDCCLECPVVSQLDR